MKPPASLVRPPRSRRHGFTLIEILIVLAIIGILAAILFPVFARVREAGRIAACSSNIHQMGLGARLYANDNGRLPVADSSAYPTACGWPDVLFPYVRDSKVFSCPDRESVYNPACGQAKTEKYAGSYQLISSRLHVIRTEPTTGIYIMDGNGVASYPGLTQRDGTTLINAQTIASGVGPARHNEGYNVGFLDGHVKWLKPESMADPKMWGAQFPHSEYTLDPAP